MLIQYTSFGRANIHDNIYIYILHRTVMIIAISILFLIFYVCAGIIAGGMSACITFVVQSSRDSNVRGVFTGDVVRSNTAWSGKMRYGISRMSAIMTTTVAITLFLFLNFLVEYLEFGFYYYSLM
jgi:MFS superfamily sulfate permease-like transporter